MAGLWTWSATSGSGAFRSFDRTPAGADSESKTEMAHIEPGSAGLEVLSTQTDPSPYSLLATRYSLPLSQGSATLVHSLDPARKEVNHIGETID